MKKSKLLLISWILSGVYIAYLIIYFSDLMAQTTGNAQLGVGLAGVFVFPHALAVFIGFIFNFFGWSLNKRGFALTGAILYSVSMLLFPFYFFFVIIQTVLSYIGYAKLNPHN